MLRFHKELVSSALFCCLVPLAIAQFTEQGPKLVGTGAVGFPLQGYAVALSADGNTALVGGYADNGGAGAVWVFTRTGGVWSQQGTRLVAAGATGTAFQGFSVALSADGSTALVGGYEDNGLIGAAWVFARAAGVWTQQGAKLVGTGASGNAQQGSSVALSADGNTALVGGYADNDGLGAAWVFTRNAGVWTQQGNKLVGTNAVGKPTQAYPVALSADGNTALLGGNRDNGGMGAAWVFTRNAGVWTQQGEKLVGSGATGIAYQGWGAALSADGNTAILGAYADDNYVGAAWVFTRSGGVWTQQGEKLVGTGALQHAEQGIGVSLSGDGNMAFVGGPTDNASVGAVWVYSRAGGVWKQQDKLVGSGMNGTPLEGWSISSSFDGRTVLVGGLGDNRGFGAAWIFASPEPSVTNLSASLNPTLFGQPVTFTASVTSGATGTVTFTVDGVPQSTVIWNGVAAKFTISNFAPGNHTVSATYNGDPTFAPSTSNVVSQTVSPLGVISLWANTVVSLGQSARLPVSLVKPAPPAGLTVYLTSHDPSKVTVTPSVFIPGGRTIPNLPPQVTGLNLGTASIAATALGYTPATQSVRVTAMLAFARCFVTITGTTTQTAVLNLSSPAPSDGLTIDLLSDTTNVATVPATVTFAAHSTTVNVPITGVATGTAVIHASSLPDLADVNIKVTVR